MFLKDIIDYYKNPHYYIRADFPSGEFFAYPVSKKKRKEIDAFRLAEILARQKQTENDLIRHISDKMASEIFSEIDKEIILDIQTNLNLQDRKLKARWSYEAAQDLRAIHDIDFSKELFAFYRQEQLALALEEDLINQQLAGLDQGPILDGPEFSGPDYEDGPEFAGYENMIPVEGILGEDDIMEFFRKKLFEI